MVKSPLNIIIILRIIILIIILILIIVLIIILIIILIILIIILTIRLIIVLIIILDCLGSAWDFAGSRCRCLKGFCSSGFRVRGSGCFEDTAFSVLGVTVWW